MAPSVAQADPPAGSDVRACAQRSVNGSFDVQAGGGEYGYRAVRVGDQQFDLGAAEHHTLGAGLNQAHDDVAIGLPGLLADHPKHNSS
jgi:hypothetical protein